MSSTNSLALRGTWLAIFVLFAVVVAVGAAMALKAAGAKPQVVLTTGGGTFIATMGLFLTAWQFLSG